MNGGSEIVCSGSPRAPFPSPSPAATPSFCRDCRSFLQEPEGQKERACVYVLYDGRRKRGAADELGREKVYESVARKKKRKMGKGRGGQKGG
jgi:hypothetical protein